MKLNRFLLVFITAMIVLILQIPVSYAAEIIESGECGWNITWTVDSNGLMTISGEGDMWDDRVAKYVLDPIIGEGDSFTWLTERVTEIIIEDGVESIGKESFLDFYNLRNITIPNSVKTIKKDAFKGCNTLESIYIPAGVTSIDPHAFYDCISLERIDVSDQNTVYKSSDGMLVSKDGKIIYAAEIIDSGECGWDITWTLDSNGLLTISGEGDMWDDPVMIDRRTTIWDTRESVTEVIIEDGVESIGEMALSFKNLKNVTIPNSVKTIKKNAFWKCDALESIYIPAGVTSISPLAFQDCTSLERIDVSDQNTVYKSLNGMLVSKDGKTIHYCPLAIANIENFKVPNGIEIIGDYAFYYNRNLKTITFPSTLTSILDYSFEWCTKLRTVTIPDSVTHIGHRAFGDCKMLKTITIPGSVKEWGVYVFELCDALETATFLQGVTEIPESGFFKSNKLKTVYIPSTVKYIKDYAFEKCWGLTDVYFGGSEYDWNNNMRYGKDILLFLKDVNVHYNYFVEDPNSF